MKKNKNREKEQKNHSVLLIVMAVVLSALVSILLIYEACAVRDKAVSRICDEKAEYLSLLAKDIDEETGDYDAVIEEIMNGYVTSASDFCFVTEDGKLEFVRDKELSEKEKGKEATTYLGISDSYRKLGSTNIYDASYNGRDFKVIRMYLKPNGRNISIGIAVSTASIVGGCNFDLQLEHMTIYMILLSLSFIVSVVFLSNKEREMRQYEERLKKELKENWKLIGKLGDRIEAGAEDKDNAQYGFCSKETIDDVIGTMSREQKQKSRRINICLLEGGQSRLVRYTVVLERMKMERSLVSLYDDNFFTVVMLNTSDTAVQNFVKQFLLTYQSIFRKDARDVTITVEEIQ